MKVKYETVIKITKKFFQEKNRTKKECGRNQKQNMFAEDKT